MGAPWLPTGPCNFGTSCLAEAALIVTAEIGAAALAAWLLVRALRRVLA